MFLKILFLCLFFFNNLFSTDVTYSGNTTLSTDLRLSLSQRAVFNNTLTLDGAGYYFQFPITPDQTLIVNNGFTATITNLLLNHFQNAHLNIGSGSSIIFGNNTVLNCILDQTLTNTLMFSGNATLIGNYTTINLGTGVIEVETNGTLTLENINLTNVTTSNLRCVDNTSKLKFSDVTLSIPSRWNFSTGSFSVNKNLEVKDGIFAYTSAYTSTILSNSNLIFSNNLSFSYDPVILSSETTARNSNLTFTNTSSWLVLNGSDLYVTNTGLQLLKGSLSVIGKNRLYSDASLTNSSQGLIFGNNDVNYDFQVSKFNSLSSSIDIKSGLLTYANDETRRLKFGDGLVLKNKKYGFYLYTNDFDWTPTGRVLGGTNTISDKTIWVTANNDPLHPWTDAGQTHVSYANFSTSPPDDSYILVNKNYASSNFLGVCATASGGTASRVSSGAYTLAFAENVNTETTKRVVSFFKASHPVAQQLTGGQAYNAVSAPLDELLQEGNDICIMSNGAGSRGMWLTGTNQTFVENSETINEVAWYKGTGGDGSSLISGTPSDSSHVWTVVTSYAGTYQSLQPRLVTPVPIKYGDGLVLKNKKYGFYLYSSDYDWSRTGRVLGGTSTISDKTIWVTANDNVDTPWSDAGQNLVSYANFTTGPADAYILVNKNYAATDYLGICSTAAGSESARVSSGAHTLAFTENVNVQTIRRTVSFLKASHPVAQQLSGGQAYNAVSEPLDQTLNEGDEICIMSNGSGGRGMWLTGTNQTFVENGETINEVSWYKGTGGDGASLISGAPSDGSHIWTIEQASNAAYTSLPSALAPPPVPLHYGDGVILKNKNYGTYLTGYTAINGADQSYVLASSSSSTAYSKWLIEPGNTPIRFGSPSLVGTAITSGDTLRLENYGLTGGNRDGTFYLYYRAGNSAPVSSPNPPYELVDEWDFSGSPTSLRIFKKGASIGAAINQGDQIYIQHYETGNSKYYYLGASNYSYLTGKEVYIYSMASASAPPGIDSTEAWLVDTVLNNLYSTAPTNNGWSVGQDFGATASNYNSWPSASLTQF